MKAPILAVVSVALAGVAEEKGSAADEEALLKGHRDRLRLVRESAAEMEREQDVRSVLVPMRGPYQSGVEIRTSSATACDHPGGSAPPVVLGILGW